jgi:hypothetical protein
VRLQRKLLLITRTRPTGYASGLTLTQKRSHFIQRPLCKVDAKLSTEKLAPTAYIPSYPQAAVDNCGQNPVHNPWLAVPPARAGGGGPAGKGHGDGTPTNIF